MNSKDCNGFGQVFSVNEWAIIKPSDKERNNNVKEGMKEGLRTNGQCNKCTSWNMEVGWVKVRQPKSI